MHSMTGYGKGVSKRDGKTITIEIKTVNHRFLDCNIKLPRNFLFVEDRVKKAVSSAISRGHVDLYLTYEQSSTDEGAYTVDLELANNYLTAVRQLENGTGLANDVTLSTLLRVGDIVTRQQSVEDEDLLAEMTLEAASEALVNLKVMREKEGQSQKADIASKLGPAKGDSNHALFCKPVQRYPRQKEYRLRLSGSTWFRASNTRRSNSRPKANPLFESPKTVSGKRICILLPPILQRKFEWYKDRT